MIVCVYVYGVKVKLSFEAGYQLINVEGIMEIVNHHFAIIVITYSDKNHQHMLKLVDKSFMRNSLFIYAESVTFHKFLINYKRKTYC